MAMEDDESPLDFSTVRDATRGDGVSVDGEFAPTDADIDAAPVESDPPRINLIEDPNLVAKALGVVQSSHTRYSTDRADMEDLWRDIDYMWKCAKNQPKRNEKTNKNDANGESTTHARTGSTLFYKQTTRLATQTLSVLFGKPEPARFRPIYSDGAFLKEEEGRAMADQHNAVARWNNIQDGFEGKLIEGTTQLNKYGNIPVIRVWKRRKAERWAKTPVRGTAQEEGGIPPIVGYGLERKTYHVNNHLSLVFVPNENFYADRRIGNMQDQNCVGTWTLANLCAFHEGAREGQYDRVGEITPDMMYQGTREGDLSSDKRENLGQGGGTDTNTGLFEQWDWWVRLPIDENGVWDEAKNYPVIYWLTFVGDIKGAPKCIRFERNPDPLDEIPAMMWHQMPDDGDSLYHIASAQIVQSNYDELTTAKNQAIDNRTLHNRKPLKAVYGEVYSDDLKFGADKIIYVERMDSIGEFQLTDITGTIMANIGYLEEDSNKALNTDRSIEGMPLGQRTSASEAVNVYEQAKMPHLIGARYQLAQLLNFYYKAIPPYWHLFALPGQILELTKEEERQEVKADQLYGDYEVVLDVVEEAANDSVRLQSIDFALMNFLQNPAVSTYMDVPETLKEWYKLHKWNSAARFVKNPTDFDAERVARAEQDSMVMSENPEYIEPSPGENTAAHIKTHKVYLAQFDGIKDADQQWPGLAYLRQHLRVTELHAQASAVQQMPPMAQAPQAATAGQAQGNMLAAAAGAMGGAGG